MGCSKSKPKVKPSDSSGDLSRNHHNNCSAEEYQEEAKKPHHHAYEDHRPDPIKVKPFGQK